MRRGAAHLTLVVGNPSTAGQLQSALEGHGVDHAAVIAHVNSIRRSLVLGEKDFVVVCIALDEPTMKQHGKALRSLLSDHECFPTTVRTVGLLTDLGLTREVAELGCDVYVDNSAQAARAIRLLDDAWTAESDETAIPDEPGAAQTAEPGRWRIRGGWMFGSPELPVELTSLVPSDPSDSTKTPRRSERADGDFEDLPGPQ